MNVRSAASKAKVAVLAFLFVYLGLSNPSFAADSASGGIGTQHVSHDRIVQPYSSSSGSTGFDLDYYHAYKNSKTYAVRLKNGLRASLDFDRDTVKLTDRYGNTVTVPLRQALLKAADGNQRQAADMYNQMHQSISTAHSDAITTFVGQQNPNEQTVRPGISSHQFFPPPRTTGGFGDMGTGLWSTPTHGECWPIPAPCHQWGGGLSSNWGMYHSWWASGFNDPPPTPEPPRPDGCARGNMDCILWEHDREKACDDLTWDKVTGAGSAILAGAACGATGLTAGALALTCAAGISLMAGEAHKHLQDSKQCHTPYPGRQ